MMYASARAPSAPHFSLSVSLSLSFTDDKFAKEELGLDANVCQTHATAIAANNGSHKKYFDYDCFYGFVMRWQRYSFAAVGRQVSCVSFTSMSRSQKPRVSRSQVSVHRLTLLVSGGVSCRRAGLHGRR